MLVEVDPSMRVKVGRVIAEVGEGEFRRGVANMTGYDTEALSLNDVVCVYVMARQGRVRPPVAGRRAATLYPALPPRTADDPCLDVSGGPLGVSSPVVRYDNASFDLARIIEVFQSAR